MIVYRYSAVTSGGKKVTGVFEAESLSHLKKMLRGQSLILTTFSEKRNRFEKQRLPKKERLPFVVNLSQLLSAGLPLFESLELLKNQASVRAMKEMIAGCLDRLREGKAFSVAVQDYKGFFDERFVAMLESGEQSGSLAEAMEVLVKALEKEQAKKKKLFGLLFYPAMLLLFAGVVMAVVLLFVIPSLEELFGTLSGSGFTGLVFGFSKALREHGGELLAVVSMLAAGLFFYRRKAKESLEKIVLALPHLRNLFIENSLAEFCLTLSMLLKAGVPLLEALAICERRTKAGTQKAFLQKSMAEIQEGISFSRSLEGNKQLPPFFAKMIAASEDTGTMQEACAKLSSYFEEAAQGKIEKLMAIAQPLILIIMGAFIAAIMLAVLLPLSDPNLLLRG